MTDVVSQLMARLNQLTLQQESKEWLIATRKQGVINWQGCTATINDLRSTIEQSSNGGITSNQAAISRLELMRSKEVVNWWMA